MEDLRVSVEPEFGNLGDGVARVRPSFPMRPGKTQRPLLPDETLRRDRLFHCLAAGIHRRVTYVVAEAGFGKTTLVADFLRNSQIRTFWYRLDEDDTDGLVFLRYVVAACQAVDPRLLRSSASLLSDVAIEPRENVILQTLLGEIDCLGEVPSALVLDDFQFASSVPAIGTVVERLLSRSPDGLSLIVIGRRTPSLAVAAQRAHGQLVELGREELRFDESETCRLFRESYHHPLEPDILHEVQTRTEGWAASLQLVKAAVEGLSKAQVRAFVHSLSGADGDLYDFLAEEVVGELDAELRNFLMRVALLEEIDTETAAAAAAVSTRDARRLLVQAQRIGLLSKGVGLVASWRLHPLVCDFLLARLDAELGPSGVTDLHRHLASALEPRSWRLAARHYAAAGEESEVRRVISSALPTIIGTGDFAVAEELMTRFPDLSNSPWYDIIRTRQLAGAGRYEEAAAVSLQAEEAAAKLALDSRTFSIGHALNKLHLGLERQDSAMRLSGSSELAASGDLELESIARAAELLGSASDSGSLDQLCDSLSEAASISRSRHHSRYEAISLLNLSIAEVGRGNCDVAISVGELALQLLHSTGAGVDATAAHLNAAKGLAHCGRWAEAQSHVTAAIVDTTSWIEPDALAETAELQAMYGDPSEAMAILRRAACDDPGRNVNSFWTYVTARVELEHGKCDHASDLLSDVVTYGLAPGFGSAIKSLRCQILAAANAADAALDSDLEAGIQFAEHQQAWFWWKTMRLTQALVSSNDALASHLRLLSHQDAAYLSIQAELVARRLADLDEAGLEIVRREAILRPERWRWAIRQALSGQSARPEELRKGARLLDEVGDANDVVLLRRLARRKSLRIPDAGRALARRLASPVLVDDLGRVTIRIGERVIPGTDIRKKVLSLLTFLLTRPQFSASREQVIEALWPDMEPEAGANSLNQTSYFLRQVFEPKAGDDSSAGYLNSRADLIWLDPTLVHSRSSECLKLIAAIRKDPSPGLINKLAESYTGRFAVDFMYDDWASAYRDALHASFLDRIERALTADTRAGAFDRALAVAQMALQADPDAEQIELCLLRLYRRMGAGAAAAEQYTHYAGVMREQLGVEPPPLESI
jgi:ATP/maltotriose-dependent transcriptional regulator MalT/DNA-binding SARP family transcriptional activator